MASGPRSIAGLLQSSPRGPRTPDQLDHPAGVGLQNKRQPMGSVVKKRRKRMSKKKHRKQLRKTRHQRRNKK
ncbi:hypothetical protein GCM10009591_32450 [Brachybacterium tyrofermentans]